MKLELDHLVVAAASLDVGRRWCEATFGVAPEPGGRHVAMATHNLLLSLASPRRPRAYLEIIAIDPDGGTPSRRRWFDLDSPALLAQVAKSPVLVHWVARSDDIDTTAAWLRSAGHDAGEATAAERQTALGMLRWRITLRADGCRPADGAVPLLIAWGAEHPSSTLPARGVVLHELRLGGIAAEIADRLGGIADGMDAAPLTATFDSPRGRVTLAAPRQGG
ncbi:MAG: VOC family protein [Caldimonas sp.]